MAYICIFVLMHICIHAYFGNAYLYILFVDISLHIYAYGFYAYMCILVLHILAYLGFFYAHVFHMSHSPPTCIFAYFMHIL